MVAVVVRDPARTRRASVFGPDAGDRRAGGHDSGRFYFADGTIWHTALSCRRGSLAQIACAGGRFAGHGLLVVPLVSGCAWQRSSTNESRSVRAGRPHHVGHGHRKILLHFRRRLPAAYHLGAKARRSTVARGSRGRGRGGVQHTARRGAVFAGGSCWRFARTRAGLSGARFGDFLGDAALAVGQQSALPRSAISTGESGGILEFTRCWEWRAALFR